MGRSFRVAKRSSIRDVALQTDVALEHDRIQEKVVVRTERAVPMRFGYHFMHAWTPSATAYAAGRAGEEEAAGELRDAPEFNRQFYVNREMDWIAVYDAPVRQRRGLPVAGTSTVGWRDDEALERAGGLSEVLPAVFYQPGTAGRLRRDLRDADRVFRDGCGRVAFGGARAGSGARAALR